MCQTNEAAEPLARAAVPAAEYEEEFVLELMAHDERHVEGFVHHLRSGRREAVSQWEDVTEIINRFLAMEDMPAPPDGS